MTLVTGIYVSMHCPFEKINPTLHTHSFPLKKLLGSGHETDTIWKEVVDETDEVETLCTTLGMTLFVLELTELKSIF